MPEPLHGSDMHKEVVSIKGQNMYYRTNYCAISTQRPTYSVIHTFLERAVTCDWRQSVKPRMENQRQLAMPFTVDKGSKLPLGVVSEMMR